MVSTEILVLNFLLGLLASFSPCMFPLLPSYVAITVKTEQSSRNTLLSSLFLIAGILVVFGFFGLIINLLGSFLIRNYSSFAKLQSIILVIAGVIMIKTPNLITKIHLPIRIERFLFTENKNQNIYVFNFLVGLSYTIIAAPCAASIFITVWANFIGKSIIYQFFIVLSFSFGAGLPFIIMSLYIPQIRSDIIGKIHNAQRKISITLGIILIFVGLWLYTEVSPVEIPGLS